jgi:NADH-quinone oxidoreductase subunit A
VDDYLPLVVMFVLAVGFVIISIAASRLLAPSRPTSAKDAPYESGIVPTHGNPQRFSVSFFLVAMIFVVFDIEIIFLYPWAVIYRELGAYGLWAILLFTLPIVASFVWEISQGGLDWGPARRSRRLDGTVAVERTTASTVVRIPSREQVAGEAAVHEDAARDVEVRHTEPRTDEEVPV